MTKFAPKPSLPRPTASKAKVLSAGLNPRSRYYPGRVRNAGVPRSENPCHHQQRGRHYRDPIELVIILSSDARFVSAVVAIRVIIALLSKDPIIACATEDSVIAGACRNGIVTSSIHLRDGCVIATTETIRDSTGSNSYALTRSAGKALASRMPSPGASAERKRKTTCNGSCLMQRSDRECVAGSRPETASPRARPRLRGACQRTG